jgi:hypothetical protein
LDCQNAIEFFIRVVSGCYKSDQLPTIVGTAALNAFHQHFVSFGQFKVVYDSLPLSYNVDPEQQDPFLQNRAGLEAQMAPAFRTNFRELSIQTLRAVSSAISKAGFENNGCWAPDLSQPAYSFWNLAHRYVFLNLFKTLYTAKDRNSNRDGYYSEFWRFDIPARYRQPPMSVLIKLYDNFVHSYWYELARREHAQRGAVSTVNKLRKVYRQRKAVCIYLIATTLSSLS